MASLATIAKLELWLGRDVDNVSAQQALDIASDIVRNYCGHSISQILNDTLILDGTGTNFLLLPASPVNGIDSIEIDGEVLDSDNYKWSKKGWVKRIDGLFFPATPGSIEVIFNHGYATIPNDIVGVVLSLSSRAIDGSNNIKQETIGSYSVTYGDTTAVLRADEKMILDGYRVTI